ncbi:MAG: xylulokinase [Acidimicrobiia bacterium]|nr:xylulokinase [Acidimicrobiia bacterium]
MTNGLVAGIDSSTQSTKVEVRRIDDGQVVGTGRGAHPATTPPRSEQDPAVWWRALAEALGQLDNRVRSGIVALAVAGQQHGLVLIDEHDQVIRPAKLWNDTESAPQAERLVADYGPAFWVDRCGSVPGPSFTVTKLAWVADNEPQALDRIARVMLPHDYITWRLSGAHVTDRGDASGTGWWSPTIGDYADEALDVVAPDFDDRLPTVLGPTESAGVIRPEVASELGLGPDVVVGPGTGDNMGGALGLGLGPGDLALSIGTSGTAYAVSRVPTADRTGLVAGFADATGNFLPLVCTLNATKVTEAFRRLLGADYDEFDELALSAPAGSGGVVLVPYLDGERTPNRPHATGLMHGLRSDVSRAQVARAAFEGVACGLLDGVEALAAAGVKLDGRTFLIGGGARSAAYRRIIADLSGREIIVPDDDETVATGAAVQAAVVVGQGDFAEVAERWGLGGGQTVDPDAEVAEAAGEARRLYWLARDLSP